MNEEDIIIVDDLGKNGFEKVVEEAVRYSIISLPFTIDRMSIPNEKQRALNIAKGKTAEGLFKCFCEKNNISIDFKTCETPFWQIDKRDFMYNGYEWDIKNNFLYLEDEIFDRNINLPALIPNRHARDQWSTRNSRKIDNSKGVKYLFTFMKGAKLENGQRGEYFLDINLSSRQKDILRKLYQDYKGLPTDKEPFSELDFWNDFLEDNECLFTLNFMPPLVITGYADDNNWEVFKDTGPYSNNNYIEYVRPFWYEKVGKKNSLKWFEGILWTTITNRTAPVEYLNSFYKDRSQEMEVGTGKQYRTSGFRFLKI